jgi:hypothetical protein
MPTEAELASLPHIVMTSDFNWDPSHYDKDIDNIADFPHLKMIMQATTSVSMGRIVITLLLLISPVLKKNFMTHVSFSTLRINLMN